MVDGRRVAPLELADSYGKRRQGLLKRDGVGGAFWLLSCRHVHTMGMRFAIDVALVDKAGVVLETQTLPQGRLSAFRWRCRSVLEAEAGAFAAWGLQVGSRVDVHGG